MQTNPRTTRRNVQFYGTPTAGAEPIIIGGFYTYNDTSWAKLYDWCRPLLVMHEALVIDNLRFYDYNPNTNAIGDIRDYGPAAAQQGDYIARDMKAQDAEVQIYFRPYRGRLRVPTMSNTSPRADHYRTRSHARDNFTCLITHLQPATNARLKAAHIFPRSHDAEWKKRGFASLVTDTAPPATVGGPTKIDSVQNVITLRSDLRDAWDAYELGVDIHDNYKVIAFTSGNQDVHGDHLQLGHIVDPTLRPLDVLLKDHFMQCVFKNMCGAGEEEEEHQFDDDPFESHAMDMSDTARWTCTQGKHLLEHALRDRLFSFSVAQSGA